LILSVDLAAADALVQVMKQSAIIGDDAPIVVSALAFHCLDNEPCMEILPAQPRINTTLYGLGYVNGGWTFGSQSPDANSVFEDFYSNVTNNFLYAMQRAVGVDIGRATPDNFLVNPSIINDSLFQDQNTLLNLTSGEIAPQPLLLPQILNGLSVQDVDIVLPLALDGFPVVVQAPYLCHFTVPKPAGQAFVLVAVATLTGLGTIWTIMVYVLMLVTKMDRPQGTSTRLAERNDPLTSKYLFERSLRRM
jgi:hypothetical protein